MNYQISLIFESLDESNKNIKQFYDLSGKNVAVKNNFFESTCKKIKKVLCL